MVANKYNVVSFVQVEGFMLAESNRFTVPYGDHRTTSPN